MYSGLSINITTKTRKTSSRKINAQMVLAMAQNGLKGCKMSISNQFKAQPIIMT